MKRLILAALFCAVFCAVSAFACSVGSTTDCPANWPGTAGSQTPAVVANSAYAPTGVTSVSSIRQVSYGSCTLCTFSAAWPTGATNLQPIFCIHGGGWSAGDPTETQACGENVSSTADVVTKVQSLAATPNWYGGTGYIIYNMGYTLSGTAPMPAQWQNIKCFAWWFQANGGTSVFPGGTSMPLVFGSSSGAHLAWMLANTPNSAFAASCPSAPAYPSQGYRTVAVSMPFSIVDPPGNAMYDGYVVANCVSVTSGTCNTIHAGINAINGLYGCGAAETYNLAACRANGTGMDPYDFVVQSNYALLAQPTLIEGGGYDTLIVPGVCPSCTSTWGSGGGGNIVTLLSMYAALTPPLYPPIHVFPGEPHLADLQNGLASFAWLDAIAFLTPPPTTLLIAMGR